MPQIKQLMLLPLTGVAELLHYRKRMNAFPHCAVFCQVVLAVHIETIPTSTVARHVTGVTSVQLQQAIHF